MANKRVNRWAPVLLLVLLLIAWGVVRLLSSGDAGKAENRERKPARREASASRGLNRQPAAIHYSKHARCRMDCRKITAREVEEILRNGKINYDKSEIGNQPECRRKYAVEGNTRDGQRVRIIFAPCKEEVTVVTVIDLGKDWPCDCD